MVTQEDKNFLTQYQAYQQRLQTIMVQKENLKLQKIEIEKAIEELDASKQKKAFKIAGPIMIKKNAADLKTELNEAKETVDMRVKTLEKTEEMTIKKLKNMEPKLKELLGKHGG